MSNRFASFLTLLLLMALGSGTTRGPETMDALETRVAEIEQRYVEQLLSVYWDGVAAAGEQDPLVLRWQARLVRATEAVALASVADPDAIAKAARASGAAEPQHEIEMVIAVWDRIAIESKAVDRPTGPVFRNVAPPDGVLAPAGIDPSAIEDEALRAEYERAIAENHAIATQLRKAAALDRALELYSAQARTFLRNKMVGMTEQDRGSLENMLRQATHLNPDHVAGILGESP